MDKDQVRKLAGLPLLESKESDAVDEAISLIEKASSLLEAHEKKLSKKKVSYDHHDDFGHIISSLGKVIDDLLAVKG